MSSDYGNGLFLLLTIRYADSLLWYLIVTLLLLYPGPYSYQCSSLTTNLVVVLAMIDVVDIVIAFEWQHHHHHYNYHKVVLVAMLAVRNYHACIATSVFMSSHHLFTFFLTSYS